MPQQFIFVCALRCKSQGSYEINKPLSCSSFILLETPELNCPNAGKLFSYPHPPLFSVYLFSFERESTSGEGTEREGEREPQGGSVSADPNMGLDLTNLEIMT